MFSWKSLMFYSKIIVSGKNVKIFIIKWMFWHVTYWKYTYLYCMFGMFGLENQKTYIFTLYFLFFWFWGLPTQKLRFENYWIWQSCLRCVKTKKNKKYNLNMIVFWFYKPKKLKIQCKYMYFQCITCKNIDIAMKNTWFLQNVKIFNIKSMVLHVMYWKYTYVHYIFFVFSVWKIQKHTYLHCIFFAVLVLRPASAKM